MLSYCLHEDDNVHVNPRLKHGGKERQLMAPRIKNTASGLWL